MGGVYVKSILSFTWQESIICVQDAVSTVIKFDNFVHPNELVTTQLKVVNEFMVVVTDGPVVPVGDHKKV